MTLTDIDSYRYIGDVLMSSDSLADLKIMPRESRELGGFNLRKWVANDPAKTLLLEVPQCDLAPALSEITIGIKSMPDSKVLGII